ncbi:hypothetical protein IFM89_008405 [Coptis chinensis]|uniref:PsbP C-terminal domain-containing protein n=1 Tax=Coptis chinensis TaxID=261450 RepID=A0A835LKW0_9MAGN|nr:hypothetical protein IFM89_008405 [Coptis chinensis]
MATSASTTSFSHHKLSTPISSSSKSYPSLLHSSFPPEPNIISTNTSSLKLPTTTTQQTTKQLTCRRDFLTGIALVSVLVKEPLAAEAREVEVGSYLPPFPTDSSFVVFKATPKDTPALRAGNVQPYEFILPPAWKQTRIANILSGNYCQPKCAEPWVEVRFENEKQGKVQVVASPLIRLTNKPNATIEDIGSPEKLIASLGPFVTGNTLDPDEVLETSVEKHGDQTYYTYVLETPFALTGAHNLAKATAKGNTVILFVASANDKQWQTSKNTLKTMLDSFQI